MTRTVTTLAIALLTLASSTLLGCGGGFECGPDTVERRGECVAVALACPHGQAAVGNTCVDLTTLCGDGAVYFEPTGRCLSAEGTPTGTTCGANTFPNDLGQCVVGEPVTCTSGTMLDPMTNSCVVTAEVCGPGAAFGDDATCQPTSEVCGADTFFDDDTGLCLPALGCRPGDVVHDGLCLSPAEALAADAAVDADGALSHPGLGGTPHTLPITAGETTSFVGTIVAPSDLSGDGELDQHFDYFVVAAEPGDAFDVHLFSLGLPAPQMEIWLRYVDDGEEVIQYLQSTATLTGNTKSRHVRMPVDGYLLLQIGPEAALAGDAPPMGGADFHYVGAITPVEGPEPQAHSLTDGDLLGSFSETAPTLIDLSDLPIGDELLLSFVEAPDHLEPSLSVWAGPDQPLITGIDSVAFTAATGSALLLVDWRTSQGEPTGDFRITAEVLD